MGLINFDGDGDTGDPLGLVGMSPAGTGSGSGWECMVGGLRNPEFPDRGEDR